MKKYINTVTGLTNYIRLNIKDYYPVRETDQLIYLILNHLLSYSKIDIHLKGAEPVSEDTFQQTREIINQIIENKPIQYIFGYTEFYGINLKVNPHVLIPRQETEELVDWIVKEDRQNNPIILDIGTGSGCIALALAKNLTRAVVDAFDISEKALALAKENAQMNAISADFFQFDLLGSKTLPVKRAYNIIVSNPPYVTFSEKKHMSRNVIDFEPSLALFVNDNDPILFYKKIAEFGLRHLKKAGSIYLEINENFAPDIKNLLKDYGYADISLKKDINGKDRMIKTIKS